MSENDLVKVFLAPVIIDESLLSEVDKGKYQIYKKLLIEQTKRMMDENCQRQ